MKIAVTLIVFNGSPYLEKWVNHYLNCTDVDYVCIAEGATQNMVDVLGLETPNSTDNTIDVLNLHRNNPKLIYKIATKPYYEKVEQQNTYMELVPEDTDYIFVADSDEFYHYSDIHSIKNNLQTHGYTYVEFFMYHFWKNTHTIGIGGNGWGYNQPIDRIFKYHKGAKFTNHRPITLLNDKGISVKEINPLYAKFNPVYCFHYSYITLKNVYEKMLYYSKTFNRDYINNWYNPVWLAWDSETKYEIERKYSIHPTVPGATTKELLINHPIDVSEL